MKINNIEHVSINCSDFEKSKDFYGRILRFHQRQTINCGDFDITYFEIPGGSRLELFDYHCKNPIVNSRKVNQGCAILPLLFRMCQRMKCYYAKLVWKSCFPRLICLTWVCAFCFFSIPTA